MHKSRDRFSRARSEKRDSRTTKLVPAKVAAQPARTAHVFSTPVSASAIHLEGFPAVPNSLHRDRDPTCVEAIDANVASISCGRRPGDNLRLRAVQIPRSLD